MAEIVLYTFCTKRGKCWGYILQICFLKETKYQNPIDKTAQRMYTLRQGNGNYYFYWGFLKEVNRYPARLWRKVQTKNSFERGIYYDKYKEEKRQ